MDLNCLTIQEALKGLEKKKFSAVELTRACLKQIRKYDKGLNAFITVCEDEALAEARKADKIREEAHGLNGLLRKKRILGIPVAVKDLYMTKDVETTAGSKVLKDYLPQYNATVIQRLKDAGGIIVGKLNQDAWGHGGSGENTDYQLIKNPWDLGRVPGGSSSGAGVAVAAGMCLAAGGTDTGGSVRSPASFCGVVGLKPTYGRVSRYGIVAMASSLDSIGHLTRSVCDAAKILEITAGSDFFDATTPEEKVEIYTERLAKQRLKFHKLTIGVPKEYFLEDVDNEVKLKVEAAVKLFEEQGVNVEEISLPHTEYGIAIYYIIMSSEVSSNLARYDGIRYGSKRITFGDEAKRRIMLGTYVLSAGYYEAYYKKAMQVRTLIKKDFAKAFETVDVIIAPVAPTVPFKFGEKQTPLELYLADIFVEPANLAGIPALALPCGFSSSGLPIGMQIMGPQFSEELLFRVGHTYQQLTDWHKRRPNL